MVAGEGIDMKFVIKAENHTVVATHNDNQEIEDLYPLCYFLTLPDSTPVPENGISPLFGMTVDEAKIVKKDEVKRVARRKILKIIPEWKQANYNARASELIDKKASGQQLTQDEQIELDSIRSVWETVKNIRLASDSIEIEIDNLVDINAVATYDVETNTLWPV